MATLAEELFLLAHDASGKAIVGGEILGFGLAGAQLMELAFAGRITIAGHQVMVTDPAPLGDPMLDAALARVSGGPATRRTRAWVTRLGRGSRDVVSSRLVDAGILSLTRYRAAGIFLVRRVPEVDGSIKRAAMSRLYGAVLHGADPEPRTAALVSLALACHLAARIFPDADRKQVKRQMREVAEAPWADPELTASVADITAAITAAIAAASSSG